MITLLGISHQTAPVSIREQFSLNKDQRAALLHQLKQLSSVSGAVIISTCNRTEIYVSSATGDEKELIAQIYSLWQNMRGSVVEQSYFYEYSDNHAAHHLFRVTSGLLSIIVGEDQVIGQVKDAYQESKDLNCADNVLMKLFDKSLEAGKRVRTETGIKNGATSVSYAAVEVCYDMLQRMDDKNILLIGAGETGSLALNNIIKHGVGSVAVTNRTYEKAQVLAQKNNGTVIAFDKYTQHLANYDVVIVATGSQTPLVSANDVKEAMPLRSFRQQIYIDLSVPRNVEHSVGEIENVTLLGVDDLQNIISSNKSKRLAYSQQSEEIIAQVLAEYKEWLGVQNLRPTINLIQNSLQQVNRIELEGFKQINSDEVRQVVDQYAEHLTRKYARMFITKLKNITDNGKRTEYLEMMNELFELNEK